MPINVPSFSGGRGIPWLTTDVAAQAKVDAMRRRTAALGELGGALKRGFSNYEKGGIRGMLDPQYAQEQEQGRTEQAELEGRLSQQQMKAVDESTPGTQKGQPAAEPVVKPDDPTAAPGQSWLSQLGDEAGGIAKKIWQGPSDPVDLQRLARMRGQVKRREDITKEIQAAAPAIKFQHDPAALIQKIATKGYEGLEPGDIQPADTTPPGYKNSDGYQQALHEAGGDPAKVDPARVQQLNEAADTRAKQRDADITAAHREPRQPTAAELSRTAAITDWKQRHPGGGEPTEAQIAVSEGHLEERAHPTKGRGRGSANTNVQEKKAREMAGLVGADPERWPLFVGVKDYSHALLLKQQLDEQTGTPADGGSAPNAGGPPAGTGHPAPDTKGAPMSKPDRPPLQHDGRLNQGTQGQGVPGKRREPSPGAPPPPPKNKPRVSIWEP
jgi:hypothetical protein